MRKSTKIAVVLAAAALLVAGFAFTTLAKGWVKEADGLYYYEDAEGMKVYNEWKKDGANYYYLGDDGYMVTNTLVETDGSKYWCGADGAKVVNAWIQVPADDEDKDNLEVEYRWYRFNAKGVALKGKQTIDEKTYFFDEDCKMVYGYVNYDADNKAVVDWTTKVTTAYDGGNYLYYCGTNDEGWALTSAWRNEVVDKSTDTYEDDSKFWAFYQSSGKKAVANTTGYLWNGVRYYFDANGKMLTSWQVATREVAGGEVSVSEYYGGADDGKKVKKAWAYLKTKDSDNDNKYWFYFDNSGAARQEAGVQKINGKLYAFGAVNPDDDIYASRMLSGMVELSFPADAEYITDADGAAKVTVKTLDKWLETAKTNVYYFSGDEANDGSLKKNVTFSKEFDDDTYTLAVDADGKLCNYYNSKAKKYYRNGYLLKAAEDMRYEMVKVWILDDAGAEVSDDCYDLLSTSGAPAASGTVSDADGSYYYVVKAVTTAGSEAPRKIYRADSSLASASKAISAFKKDGEGAKVSVEGNTYYVYIKVNEDGRTKGVNVGTAMFYELVLSTTAPAAE